MSKFQWEVKAIIHSKHIIPDGVSGFVYGRYPWHDQTITVFDPRIKKVVKK